MTETSHTPTAEAGAAAGEPMDEQPLRQPGVSRLWTTTLAALAMLAAWQVTIRLERQRVLTVEGTLSVPRATLSAPHAGRVRRLLVEPGAAVSPGMAVCVLEDTDHSAEQQRLQSLVLDRQAELERRTAAAELAWKWKRRTLQAEQHTARLQLAKLLQTKFDHELALRAWQGWLDGEREPGRLTAEPRARGIRLQAGVADSSATVAPPEAGPAGQGELQRFNAMLNLEQSRNALDVVRTQVELCEQHLAHLEELDESLQERELKAAGVAETQRQLELLREQLAEHESRSAETVLTAATWGTLGVFPVKPGDRLDSGDSLATILDTRQPTVTVSVPSRHVTWLEPGQTVQLEFAVGEEITGRVASLPLQTDGSTPASGERMLKLTIEPTGRLWPTVPAGSPVTVTFLRQKSDTSTH